MRLSFIHSTRRVIALGLVRVPRHPLPSRLLCNSFFSPSTPTYTELRDGWPKIYSWSKPTCTFTVMVISKPNMSSMSSSKSAKSSANLRSIERHQHHLILPFLDAPQGEGKSLLYTSISGGDKISLLFERRPHQRTLICL